MKTRIRELVKAIMMENLHDVPVGPVFVPRDPPNLAKGTGDYFISREFGIKLTPELAQALRLSQEDLEEAERMDGVLFSEWELVLDLDTHYSKGSPARLHGHPDTWHPGDPDEFEIGNWTVEGILLYGARSTLVLSARDAAHLKDVLGDLTESETEQLRDQYFENLPEPDYDDRDYDDFD